MKRSTIERIRKFTLNRDWDQFHSPENLAKSTSIEANELLECFQWDEENYNLGHVKEELADVIEIVKNQTSITLYLKKQVEGNNRYDTV